MTHTRGQTTMRPSKESRKYDILLLGASGYTGQLTADHIAAHLPTNLKWGISSTSRAKLETLAGKLKKEHPNRAQPDIEVVSCDDHEQLHSVVGQARVCISTVLFATAGEQVVRACVENGTDYVDCAAIPSLVYTWVRKYHQQAQENEVALIHACGALITPVDVACWIGTRAIDSRWSLKTKDITFRLDELDTNLSGGTIRTVLNHASLSPQVQVEVQRPSALSLIEHPGKPSTVPGLHRHPRLGWLAATSITADQDRAFIYRTWGLLEGTDKSYGPRFEFNEYEKASSIFTGIGLVVQYYVLSFIMGLARIVPIKNLFLSLAPTPGSGPNAELAKSVPVSMEALVAADMEDEGTKPIKSARVNFLYTGGHYPLSALFMAQAAASLLYTRKLEGNIKGGCLTPAILGADFVERTQSVGVQYTTRFIEDDLVC